MNQSLTLSDFQRAAASLRCAVAAVMAVCEVEAPLGGFDADGRPRILFEGHKFSAFTGGKFDRSDPTISYPKWTRQFYATGKTPDIRNAGEHVRLTRASVLDRGAALRAASWGRFQLLGDNYQACGYLNLQAFINAMYSGESQQLDAFVAFVQHERLYRHLQALDWKAFARGYNGPDYAANSYDTKLAAAYLRAST